MRLFLYEYITGGGLLGADIADEAFPSSLLTEGRAMITALAADALRMPDVEVQLLWDARLPPPDLPSVNLRLVSNLREASSAFDQAAATAAASVVIAPESDGVLAACAASVIEAGGTLLGPAPRLIELCTDKHRTAEHLLAAGVPAPRGIRLAPGDELPADFNYPAVLKPIDGCGSQQVQLITKPSDSNGIPRVNPLSSEARLEPYLPGQAASVAVLCGPRQKLTLPACSQNLATDGTFAYLGGSMPLAPALAKRAESLALKAAKSLPDSLGYLGVDLILGSAAGGSGDAVIEINPRLTTSYVGLRLATTDNLLQAWWQIAQGAPTALSFHSQAVQFLASGEIEK